MSGTKSPRWQRGRIEQKGLEQGRKKHYLAQSLVAWLAQLSGGILAWGENTGWQNCVSSLTGGRKQRLPTCMKPTFTQLAPGAAERSGDCNGAGAYIGAGVEASSLVCRHTETVRGNQWAERGMLRVQCNQQVTSGELGPWRRKAMLLPQGR